MNWGWILLLLAAGAHDAPGRLIAPEPYADAYAVAARGGKPLVVIVTASSWCPACRVLERDVLPGLLTDRRRSGVALSVLDRDKLPDTAATVLGGADQPVPQVVVYRLSAGRWAIRRLIGLKPLAQTAAFIFEDSPGSKDSQP